MHEFGITMNFWVSLHMQVQTRLSPDPPLSPSLQLISCPVRSSDMRAMGHISSYTFSAQIWEIVLYMYTRTYIQRTVHCDQIFASFYYYIVATSCTSRCIFLTACGQGHADQQEEKELHLAASEDTTLLPALVLHGRTRASLLFVPT